MARAWAGQGRWVIGTTCSLLVFAASNCAICGVFKQVCNVMDSLHSESAKPFLQQATEQVHGIKSTTRGK